MLDLFNQIRSYTDQTNLENDQISKWSVGMQLHHALIAINGICTALADSEPGQTKQSFSFTRSMILLFGRIPRGRGKAPDSAHPDPDIVADELLNLCDVAQANYERAFQAPPTAWWKHHMFGVMTRDTVLQFVETHTRHHLLIATDIINADATDSK